MNLTVWHGVVGGAAVGAYALLQFVLTGRVLGVSNAYGNVCALFSKHGFFTSQVFSGQNQWRLWFVVGLPIGGLIAALTSPGVIEPSFSMGALYNSVLPTALWAKGAVLVLGGAMMGYGARMAGGCTSGHAIAGMSLLSLPSMLASAGFFIGGVMMVQVLFGVAR